MWIPTLARTRTELEKANLGWSKREIFQRNRGISTRLQPEARNKFIERDLRRVNQIA